MKGKKISVHTVGMALAAITIWALRAFGKIEVPAEIAVAFGTIVAVAVSILVPDDKEEE